MDDFVKIEKIGEGKCFVQLAMQKQLSPLVTPVILAATFRYIWRSLQRQKPYHRSNRCNEKDSPRS